MCAPTPSPVLSGLLHTARTTDDQDLVDTTLHAQSAARRAEAEQAVRLVALQERGEGHHHCLSAATAEIGILLGISTKSAEHLVGVAMQIVLRPLVWTAWHAGRIDRTKASHIVTLLDRIPDPHREHLEAHAIDYAETHTPAQLRKHLHRMTCDDDPDESQRKEALDQRGVSITPDGHGMAHIWAYVSAEHADAFLQALDHLATPDTCPDPYQQGDTRTLDQRRADAFTNYLEDHTTAHINVHITIPADMLMGVETRGATLNGSPVTHALALKLAWSPDARWTRLVTDPLTGILIDVGREHYDIPDATRTAIRLRDHTCRFPGCTHPAEYTDTDHVIPHRTSHRTNPSGLICLCRHHHRIKTFGTWKITTTSTYAHDTTWHGPLGTRTTTRPPHHKRD